MLCLLLLLACTTGDPAQGDAPCADLDCDGWPDLVLARTQGGADGYDEARVLWLEAAGAAGIAVTP